MIRHLLLLPALLFVAACAAQGGSTGTSAHSSTGMPAYEMMKDQVLAGKVETYIRAAVESCKSLAEAQHMTCLRGHIIKAVPQGDLAASHCATESDAFEELDCITMTSLAIDLIERSGNDDPAAFLKSINSKYKRATSDGAILFAESIWKACPDGPTAMDCRVSTAQQRLDLPQTEPSRCAPLQEDRKIVSCMILGRFRAEIDAAAQQIKAMAG